MSHMSQVLDYFPIIAKHVYIYIYIYMYIKAYIYLLIHKTFVKLNAILRLCLLLHMHFELSDASCLIVIEHIQNKTKIYLRVRPVSPDR